jgi:hypothetical protein
MDGQLYLGLSHHWIALDGLRKRSGSATWKGMNPYPEGRRIEASAGNHLTPRTVADRLISADMPVVAVEGTVRRRLQGRIVPATPRLAPLNQKLQDSNQLAVLRELTKAYSIHYLPHLN